MSLFEFVTVMVSMILALCLGHLLRGVTFLAKTDRPVEYYLPHTLWSIEILLAVVNHWWSLWDLRDVNWSYASFLYILVAPILVSLATGLLAPSIKRRPDRSTGAFRQNSPHVCRSDGRLYILHVVRWPIVRRAGGFRACRNNAHSHHSGVRGTRSNEELPRKLNRSGLGHCGSCDRDDPALFGELTEPSKT